MNLNEYQELALKTATYGQAIDKLVVAAVQSRNPESVASVMRLSYVSHGLAGEAGEFNDQVKRVTRDDGGLLTPERRQKLIKELGDVAWYLSQAARELGVTLEEVAKQNIEKLASRAQRGVLTGEGGER